MLMSQECSKFTKETHMVYDGTPCVFQWIRLCRQFYVVAWGITNKSINIGLFIWANDCYWCSLKKIPNICFNECTYTHTKKENIYQNCVKHPQSSQNYKSWLSLLLLLGFMYSPNIFIYVKLQTTNLSWATENLTTLPHQHK